MSQLLFQDFQPLAAIATTPSGAKKLQLLCQTAGATLWIPESLTGIENAQVYTGSLKTHLANIWQQYRGFVFCLATGAVVRLIAPLLEHKSVDPAVVVIDEAGQFVISLCSGHQGGGDNLAQLIAHQLGATPVLTGAASSLGLPGIDVLGVPFGWCRGAGNWTEVSATIARGEAVQVIQQAGSTLWQKHLPEKHPFIFEEPLISTQNPSPPLTPVNVQGLGLFDGQFKAKIWITPNLLQLPDAKLPQVQWHPRVLWVGVGCERGTPKKAIEAAITEVLKANNLAESAIAGIATIDIKADEQGIIELCSDRNFPLQTFPASVLNSVNVPNPSKVVAAEVGTPSVSEAAALSAAKCQNLLVTKQIFYCDAEGKLIQNTSPDQEKTKIPNRQGAVTVAIAQAEQEYTGRTGYLYLIGTGPGQLDQMTPAAQTAVTQADAVIGYSLYIDLISPLLRPGQIVEALPITQERQRAERAIALAQWGLNVAVVSSGDSGIYGMAGLVLEQLSTQNWDGKTPGVQVFPGITALQSAAARVGTPLMHDFCAISLSDLLTPWEVIEKRLTAAAQADFITALYNPRSQTRTQQIAIARDIFLQHRHPDTPVSVVRSAYRDDEQITLTTLDKLLDAPIDMLTLVLIGNQSTRIHSNWMITPRGYLGFGN
ncbi:MAG TPA: precorrin-3B C(17)-methyltransferase [Candidatus Sericytochromatia bacterium]